MAGQRPLFSSRLTEREGGREGREEGGREEGGRRENSPFWVTGLGGRHIFFLGVGFLVGWAVVGRTSTTESKQDTRLSQVISRWTCRQKLKPHVFHVDTKALMTVPWAAAGLQGDRVIEFSMCFPNSQTYLRVKAGGHFGVWGREGLWTHMDVKRAPDALINH